MRYGQSGGRNEDIVRIAFKKGCCMRGNQRAYAYQGYVPSNGIYGQAPECLGCSNQLACLATSTEPSDIGQTPCRGFRQLDCKYYSTTVFSIDYVKKRISCFNTARISKSTVGNITRFERGARRHGPEIPEFVWREYSRWTDHRRWREDWERAHFASFITRAPWLVEGWFHWELFDREKADQLWTSLVFLATDRNYRYYRYDWRAPLPLFNETGHEWGRSFIDEDAARRWHNRQKKRERDGNVCGAFHRDADIPNGQRRVA